MQHDPSHKDYFLANENVNQASTGKRTIIGAIAAVAVVGAVCLSRDSSAQPVVLLEQGLKVMPGYVSLVAPSNWGKSDYQTYLTSCFAQGDATAQGSANYHDTWNGAVNNCLWTVFNDD